VISTTIEPGTNWTQIHYNSSDVGVQLEYAFRVVCDVDYYGAACGVNCRPRDDELGHWTCTPDTGSRLCLPGWQGKFCMTGGYNWQYIKLNLRAAAFSC